MQWNALDRWTATMSAAVLLSSLFLLWDGYPLLLGHGPPMLSRDARALAIALVLGFDGVVLALLVAAVGAAARRWRGLRLALATVAAWLVARSLVAGLPEGLYLGAHVACYGLRACEWSDLPERLMFTLAASARTSSYAWVLPFAAVTAAGIWCSARRSQPRGDAAEDAPRVP